MELVLENAREFKKIIDGIAVLIDEAEFLLTEKGMELKATDPSQISLVDFNLEKKSFKKFSIENEMNIGVDLDYLSQIMSRAKSDDTLTMRLNDEKTVLLVDLSGASARKFSIPLIDVSKTAVPTPKIGFESKIKVKASVLQDAFKDAVLISTHVTIGANPNEFFVRANSSKGTLNNVTQKNSPDFSDFNVTEECQSMFPLDYLSDMLKSAPSDSSVLLEMGQDKPVRITYSIGPATLVYFLAPRIEND